jgi:FkbM family methyltransferase
MRAEYFMLRNFINRAWKKLRNGVIWLPRALLSPHMREVRRWVHANPDERYLYDYRLGPDSIVLEVGGYRGKWAQRLREQSQCQLHVFEPVPEFYEELQMVLCADSSTHLHKFGLGAHTRIDTISVCGDASSLIGNENLVPVSIVDIRDFLEARGLKDVDLMSVNIEGAEYELLPHLIESGLIKRVRALQIQFHRLGKDYNRKATRIRQALDQTHDRTFHFPFIWEGWRKRDE